MNGVTTHVLDAARGRPAADVPVRLRAADGAVLGAARTNPDGRVPDLASGPLEAGTYQLIFDTEAYFTASGLQSFYPEVVITFAVSDPQQHHHVPLLLSPFAYSTYRGS
jgi:5-hydroxyisourate hydrolase